jgi:hypothetical protein
VITNSCSQTTATGSPSVHEVFAASTPCDDASKALLKIPASTKCEWMKWNLTLYQDQKSLIPSTYKLICKYGLSKQGTRDFMEGAETIELKGKLAISKGTNENAEAVVYTLHAENSPISLSFLQPDQNLLHLIDADNRLMIGNGAWSYTLNRIDPVPASSAKFSMQTTTPPRITTDSLIVGVFDGRTPCNTELRELNGISAAGCQIIKCRLTLYQNIKTHEPTTFQLQTIYVGKGDARYTSIGKWKMSKGTKTGPEAIVYQLELDSGNLQTLEFIKADDNILFLLDKDRNFLVGNNYTSYTLNRTTK